MRWHKFFYCCNKSNAMDNKDLKGKQDRDRVAGNEEYELQYLASQMNVSIEEVQKAIAAVGSRREDVVNYLQNHKN